MAMGSAYVKFLNVCRALCIGLALCGHDWYEEDCCDKRDCAPAPAGSVLTPQDGGYVLELPDGRKFWFGPESLRPSRDKDFHPCIWYGQARCLYVPLIG